MEVRITVDFSEDVKNFFAELLTGKSEKQPATNKGKGKKPVEEDPLDEEVDPLLDEEDETPLYTQDRVREKCQQLIQDGKAAKLKALLEEFGVAKVVSLKEKDYNAFMAKAMKIK